MGQGVGRVPPHVPLCSSHQVPYRSMGGMKQGVLYYHNSEQQGHCTINLFQMITHKLEGLLWNSHWEVLLTCMVKYKMNTQSIRKGPDKSTKTNVKVWGSGIARCSWRNSYAFGLWVKTIWAHSMRFGASWKFCIPTPQFSLLALRTMAQSREPKRLLPLCFPEMTPWTYLIIGDFLKLWRGCALKRCT